MSEKLNDIAADPSRRQNLEGRYWPKVQVLGEDDCWMWSAKAKHPFGYGRMTAGRGVNLKAHQIAWTLENGPIPAGMCVLHECDEPSCCNPKHLFLGTKADNTEDMIGKGRWSRPPVMFGVAHPRAKFTDEQVSAIIADPRPTKVIAAEYGTTVKTVCHYKKNGSR